MVDQEMAPQERLSIPDAPLFQQSQQFAVIGQGLLHVRLTIVFVGFRHRGERQRSLKIDAEQSRVACHLHQQFVKPPVPFGETVLEPCLLQLFHQIAGLPQRLELFGRDRSFPLENLQRPDFKGDPHIENLIQRRLIAARDEDCLLYTSDAADE